MYIPHDRLEAALSDADLRLLKDEVCVNSFASVSWGVLMFLPTKIHSMNNQCVKVTDDQYMIQICRRLNADETVYFSISHLFGLR